MKRNLLALAIGLGFSVSAQAFWTPPADQPLYIKFTNAEQLAVTGNGITAPDGSLEQNWGVLSLTSIALGNITPPNDPYLYPAISGFNTNILPNSVQVTGIFYGIQDYTGTGCPTAICSIGGFIDLWGDDATLANTAGDISTATPSDRTGVNTFTNFTDGVFLGRLAFDWGIVTGNESVTIKGTAEPSDVLGGVQGQAESYANVIDTNGDGVIDASDGLWAALMNGDYFPVFGATGNTEYRDFRFNNNYNLRSNWSSGNDIIGAVSDDPARVYTVPEPTTLGLLGLGLLGMGFAGRRRKV